MVASKLKGGCEMFAEFLKQREDKETEYQSVRMEKTKTEEGITVVIDYLIRTRDPETKKQEEEEITDLKNCLAQFQGNLIETLRRVGEDVSELDPTVTGEVGEPAGADTWSLVKQAKLQLRQAKEKTSIGKQGEKQTYLGHLQHMNSRLGQDSTVPDPEQEGKDAGKIGVELRRLERVLREMMMEVEETGDEKTTTEEPKGEVRVRAEAAKMKKNKRKELRCGRDRVWGLEPEREKEEQEAQKQVELKKETEEMQVEVDSLKRRKDQQEQKLSEMGEEGKKCLELNEELTAIGNAKEELQREEEEEKKEEDRLAEEIERISQEGKELCKQMEAEDELQTIRAEVEKLEKGVSLKKNQLDILKRIVEEDEVSPQLALNELMDVRSQKAEATRRNKVVAEILGEQGMGVGGHLCCFPPEFVPDLREVEERVRKGGTGSLAEMTRQLDDALKNTPTDVKLCLAAISPKIQKEVKDCVGAANEGMRKVVQTLDNRDDGVTTEGEVKEVAARIEKIAQELGVATQKKE